jgi:hypothetical protein
MWEEVMSRANIIDIIDSKDRWFQMLILTPLGLRKPRWHNNISAEWKVLDEGFIKWSSGNGRLVKRKGFTLTSDLLLGLPDAGAKGSFEWGMRLFEYDEFTHTNAMGEGIVTQPWVVGIEPGKITWQKSENIYGRSVRKPRDPPLEFWQSLKEYMNDPRYPFRTAK